jgi:hypothetical protein
MFFIAITFTVPIIGMTFARQHIKLAGLALILFGHRVKNETRRKSSLWGTRFAHRISYLLTCALINPPIFFSRHHFLSRSSSPPPFTGLQIVCR